MTNDSKPLISPAVQSKIEHELGTKIRRHQSISGGDINDAYRLDTDKYSLFAKMNTYADGYSMLSTEMRALRHIESTGTIRVPEVVSLFSADVWNILLLENIETTSPSSTNLQRMGEQLASMHLVTSNSFGYTEDNYIGSLPQQNDQQPDWSSFYLQCRLTPQVELAIERRHLTDDFREKSSMLSELIKSDFPDEPPALIHGDLWSGNYLFDLYGVVLIDPAISFANREMDIAMSKLFGSCPKEVYDVYHDVYPLEKGLEHREDMYQLYYLLVHLNLFGSAYLERVTRIFDYYL